MEACANARRLPESGLGAERARGRTGKLNEAAGGPAGSPRRVLERDRGITEGAHGRRRSTAATRRSPGQRYGVTRGRNRTPYSHVGCAVTRRAAPRRAPRPLGEHAGGRVGGGVRRCRRRPQSRRTAGRACRGIPGRADRAGRVTDPTPRSGKPVERSRITPGRHGSLLRRARPENDRSLGGADSPDGVRTTADHDSCRRHGRLLSEPHGSPRGKKEQVMVSHPALSVSLPRTGFVRASSRIRLRRGYRVRGWPL